MKLDVLGTEYEIIKTTANEQPRLKNASGYCSSYNNKIYIESELFADESYTDEDLKNSKQIATKEILRHEIIHAFVKESGLLNSDINSESVVDYYASQFPKLLEAFRKADAL